MTNIDEVAGAMEKRRGAGDNLPPEEIALVSGIRAELAAWLEANPVVTEETAKAGGDLLKRAGLGLKDLDAERDSKVRPLNERVRVINADYKAASAPVARLREELAGRLDDYRDKVEAQRKAEAEKAAAEAAAAEAAARDAERRLKEAEDNARQGVFDAGVAGAMDDAQAAFDRAAMLHRTAARMEKAQNVRIATGFGRPISARTNKVYVILDPGIALRALMIGGFEAEIREVMEKCARAYDRKHGKCADGTAVMEDRAIR